LSVVTYLLHYDVTGWSDYVTNDQVTPWCLVVKCFCCSLRCCKMYKLLLQEYER